MQRGDKLISFWFFYKYRLMQLANHIFTLIPVIAISIYALRNLFALGR